MLGQELVAAHVTGSLLLLGGAIMVTEVGNRSSTRDIDASFDREAQAIRAAVRTIAVREGLPPDWLNDGAKGFLYSQPPMKLWRSFPGLLVFVISLEYLLAMKVIAGRPGDIADARALVHQLHLTRPQQVLDLVQHFIPPHYLTVTIQYVVNDLFA